MLFLWDHLLGTDAMRRLNKRGYFETQPLAAPVLPRLANAWQDALVEKEQRKQQREQQEEQAQGRAGGEGKPKGAAKAKRS